MTRKRILTLLLSLVVVMGVIPFAVGGANKQKPKIILRYGDVNPEGHVLLDSAHFFADKVSELSNGRIAIEIYPSGQLGDDHEVYQALQMGAVDLYRGNASSLTDVGNLQISALALP